MNAILPAGTPVLTGHITSTYFTPYITKTQITVINESPCMIPAFTGQNWTEIVHDGFRIIVQDTYILRTWGTLPDTEPEPQDDGMASPYGEPLEYVESAPDGGPRADEYPDPDVFGEPEPVTASVAVVEPEPAPRRRNCRRCGGRGYIGAYRHVQNGHCFRCNGRGY